MPQASSIYAVARIRAHENKLINRDRMARIAESSLEEAMRLLHEGGYGDMPDASAAEIEQMIANERRKTAQLIMEVTPDKEITDLFLLQADVHNLKTLIKARLLNKDEDTFLTRGGVFEIEDLKAYVKEQDYRDLPPAFKEALTALEKELAAKENPQRVSIALDRAYIDHANQVLLRKDYPFAKEYFAALCDFNNVLTLMRLKDIGANKEQLIEAALPAGDIALFMLLNAYDQPLESLVKLLATGRAGASIGAALSDVQRGGHVSALEKARDDYLLRLIKKDKYDVMTISPVVGFLMAREQEAKCIRLVITVKRNGLSEAIIAERMRELYG